MLQKGNSESQGDPDPSGADKSRGDQDPPRSDESLTNASAVDPDPLTLQRIDESLVKGSVADPTSTFEFDHLSVGEPIQGPTTLQFDSLAGEEAMSTVKDRDPGLESEPGPWADTRTPSDPPKIVRPLSDPFAMYGPCSDSSGSGRPFPMTGKCSTETERPHYTGCYTSRRKVQAPTCLMSLQSLPKTSLSSGRASLGEGVM